MNRRSDSWTVRLQLGALVGQVVLGAERLRIAVRSTPTVANVSK